MILFNEFERCYHLMINRYLFHLILWRIALKAVIIIYIHFQEIGNIFYFWFSKDYIIGFFHNWIYWNSLWIVNFLSLFNFHTFITKYSLTQSLSENQNGKKLTLSPSCLPAFQLSLLDKWKKTWYSPLVVFISLSCLPWMNVKKADTFS